MSDLVSWSRIRNLPGPAWVLLLGNFFVRGSYFMVWPFLAVILYQRYDLSATETGFWLTTAALTAVVAGFYAGHLSDRFGRKPLMLAGALTGVLAFSALALADTLPLMLCCIFLATLPRALWDAPSKAWLGDLLPDSKDRELALQRLALRDPLTGIANHPAIAERCVSEVEQARRSGSPLGVVLIEIDQLPSLRARQGKDVVNEALQHTAAHLAERIRRSDSVGRYGPHAFLLLLPNTPTPGARHVLRALRESMLDAPAQGSGADVLPLSISMGLWCGVPNPRDSAETLIAQAATALQAAQEAGANRMRVAA